MKSKLLLVVPILLFAAAGARVWALEGQALLDVLPTAALVQTGPSSPWIQSETTAMAAQVAVSHAQTLAEGLSLSGTVWGIADSLPSGSPLTSPAAKVDLESRILELKLTWEVVPGALVWNLGKEVIHPSSGFSRTPLDVLFRGALADTSNLTGSAVGAWEEGWIGTGVTAFLGSFTLADYFSPRLSWSSDVDQVLQYVTLQQSDYQNLTQVDFRLGEADIRVLGLVTSGGSGSSDPDVHVQLGSGLDTALGDSVTIRAEICAADRQDRTVVTDSQLLTTTSQTVSWAPRALAGFTWTNADQLSVMAEYYYNGAGFVGDDYRPAPPVHRSPPRPRRADRPGSAGPARDLLCRTALRVSPSGRKDRRLPQRRGVDPGEPSGPLGSDRDRPDSRPALVERERLRRRRVGRPGYGGRPPAPSLEGEPGGEPVLLSGSAAALIRRRCPV